MTGDLAQYGPVLSLPLALLVPTLAPLPISPQPPQDRALRAELAWRTRAVERAWIANGAGERREQALPFVEEAVQRFFRMDVKGVGEALAGAEAKLVGLAEPGPLAALRVHPEQRLQDERSDGVSLVFGWLFGESPDDELRVQVRLGEHLLTGEGALRLDPETNAFTWRGTWPEAVSIPTGDVTLDVAVAGSEGAPTQRRLSLSRVPRLEARLAALRAGVEALGEETTTIEALTLRDRVELLESLATSSSEETDFPASRLLGEAEAMLIASVGDQQWCTSKRRGQHWWTLPAGRGSSPVRLLIPESYDASKPPPLVVALHGMGGSENMFFDSYGDGRIVGLCEERGWLLLAPRVTPFGAPVEAILESLGERLPFDRERLVLLGHSMGAGAGQRLLSRSPESYAAFVAMGGGSRLREAEGLREEPVFVAAGDRDFGRPGAEALHASLVAAGNARAKLVIAPACEHLMVVAQVLPEAFQWLDRVLAR